MESRIKRAVASAAIAATCGSAMAAHPLVTDDTRTQGVGNHQLEFNTDWLRDSGVRGRIAAATYTYGVTPELDLFGNAPFSLSDPRGVGDVSIGGKWRFWEQGRSSIAVKPELLLPSGNAGRELGTGRTGAAFTVLTTHDFEPWTVHANIGFQVNRYRDTLQDEAGRRTIWRTSIAAAYALTEKSLLVFDIGAARHVERAVRANPAFALIGGIYAPAPDIDIDVGIRFGLNSAEVNRQVGAGITVRF